ncbi:putative membrane protein [Peptostreptococcaceae bacterium AS15]|nr:putative membrane protein [Peptostreptococcaceae bacterium AS15]
MKFLIFVKRYIRTPLFVIVCLCSLIICLLYQNSDLTVPGNIKIGVYAQGVDDGLIEKLLAKNSYFKYYKYDNLSSLQDNVKKKKVSYGFSIDLSKDVPFTIYGSDDKFSEVAKEDFYSTYFEILSEKYTLDLLKLNKNEYQKMFNSQIGRTYKFKYVDSDISKIFPLRESSAVLMFIAMLLVCLDYFIITDRSEFFATFAGRKNRAIFVLGGMTVNFLVFFPTILLGNSINILNFTIYNVILLLIAFIIVSVLNRDIFIKSMPIVVMMSAISVFMTGIENLRWIYLLFPSNSYVASYTSFVTIVFYLAVIVVIASLLRFKNYFSLKNM